MSTLRNDLINQAIRNQSVCQSILPMCFHNLFYHSYRIRELFVLINIMFQIEYD